MREIRVLHVIEHLGAGGKQRVLLDWVAADAHIDGRPIICDVLCTHPNIPDVEASVEVVRAHGGDVFHSPLGFKHPWGRRKRLERLLRARSYDIVHVHASDLHSLFVARTARRCGVPVRIVHAHLARIGVGGIAGAMKWCLHQLNRHWNGAVSCYIACGTAAAHFFVGHAGRCRTMRNSIDAAAFAFNPEVRQSLREELIDTQETGEATSPRVLVNVARLSPEKNQAFLLGVVEDVRRVGHDVRLWFVGDGPERERLSELVVQRHMEEWVRFLGNRDDVPSLLSAADIFVLPSHAEGFPLAALEAQAAGLPVIVSSNVGDEARFLASYQVARHDDRVSWLDAVIRAWSLDRECDAVDQCRRAGLDLADLPKRIEDAYRRCCDDVSC